MATAEDQVSAWIDGKKVEGSRGGLSITGADFVEALVSYDRSKLWVNTRKGCVLQLYGARGMFQFSDLRYGAANDIPWQVREMLWAERNGSLDALSLDPRILKMLRGEVGLLKEAQHIWTFDGLKGKCDE